MIVAGQDGNLSDLTSEPIYARDADIGGKIGSVFVLQDGYVRRVYPDSPTLSIWYDDKSTDDAAIMHISHARKNNSWCPGYTYTKYPQDLVWATLGSEMDYDIGHPTLCAGKWWGLYPRTTAAIVDEVIDCGVWPTQDYEDKWHGYYAPCHGLFAGTYIKSTDDIQNLWRLKNLQSLDSFFYKCSQLEYASFDDIDTSHVQYMSSLFESCRHLTSVNLRSLDTSQVLDMSNMFMGCSGLRSVDVSIFDTSNVRDMSRMFCGCSNIFTLDVNFPDTGALEDVSYMFDDVGANGLIQHEQHLSVHMPNCPKLTKAKGMFAGISGLYSTPPIIDLSDIDLSNVSDMSEFIRGSKFETITFEDSQKSPKKVTTLEEAFYSYTLKRVDLSGIDGSNLKSMKYLFDTAASYSPALSVVITPRNVPADCDVTNSLPYDNKYKHYVWKGSDGNIYTNKMPVGNTEPITLTRTPASEV